MKQTTRDKILSDIYDYFGKCVMKNGKADRAINDLLEDWTENKYGVSYDYDNGWDGVFSHLTNSQLRKIRNACYNSGIFENN